jgi:hypothetical protein
MLYVLVVVDPDPGRTRIFFSLVGSGSDVKFFFNLYNFC